MIFPSFLNFMSCSPSHLNLNPVVITTGVSPHGQQVMNFHGSLPAPSVSSSTTPDTAYNPAPFDHSIIDPALLDHDNTSFPHSSPSSLPPPSTTPSTPSTHSCTPSFSGQAKLDAAISKVSHIPDQVKIDANIIRQIFHLSCWQEVYFGSDIHGNATVSFLTSLW